MQQNVKNKRNSVKDLTDGYIKSLLVKGTKLKSADIPDELVRAHRAVLIVKRLLKEKRT